MIWKPYEYQNVAYRWILDKSKCGLFLDMGLGKTVVTGTAIDHLIYEEAEFQRALIIAPKYVTRTVWKQEMAKWDHLKHLKVSIVWGSVKERIAALREKADIYVINRENLVWLVNLFQSRWPFKFVVIDELSSFKNPATQRFKALQLVLNRITRLVGLTGTPAPNSLMDLWAPIYLMDQGERLEKNITGYRERYFTQKNPGERFSGYKLRKDAAEIIYKKVSDICISMKSEDYLDLPPIIENDIILELEPDMRAKYDEFEEECIMEIADKEVTALSAAALSTKLLQFANGAIYHPDKTWSKLHDTKMEALEEIIEEAFGQPVLVIYSYRHDLERIMAKFPHARQLKTEKDVVDWNNGDIPIMVIHPASAGHGLNLQSGGHIIVHFGLTWSSELYEQVYKRLHRPGQEHPVIMHRLIMKATMDTDVVRSLREKKNGQDALMDAVKARIEKHKRVRIVDGSFR